MEDECDASGGSANTFMRPKYIGDYEGTVLAASTWASSSPGPPAGRWGPCHRRETFPAQLWERWCQGWIRYLKITITFSSMDGNPAHSSKGTQVWLKNKLTEVWETETWPPSSPDCNPFDYLAAGVSELRVRANPQKKPETWSLTSGR